MSALIIIDMSNEQVPVQLLNRNLVIRNIYNLATSNKFDKCFDCRLNISDTSNTSLSKVYPSVGLKHTTGAQLLPALKILDNLEFMPKVNYSGAYKYYVD